MLRSMNTSPVQLNDLVVVVESDDPTAVGQLATVVALYQDISGRPWATVVLMFEDEPRSLMVPVDGLRPDEA